MADSKYQPVPRHDTEGDFTTHSSPSQTYEAAQDQSWRQLDSLDVSDLSSQEDDDGDETMAPLNTKKRSSKRARSLLHTRKVLTALKTTIVRHRLCLIAAAGLIFILLPLIAYQRTLRAFFWGEQAYVRSLAAPAN
jgi:hypothetical protein